MAINKENPPNHNELNEDFDVKIVNTFDKQDFDIGKKENFYVHLKNVRNQKIAIIAVGVAGILVVILWFFQMKGILNVPFPPATGQGIDESMAMDSVLDLSQLDDNVLKQQDTDNDGLSDFNELYIYNTSAYLADSDSDGTLDGEEIKNSTDPNCPVGHTCFQNAGSSAVVELNNKTNINSGSIVDAAQLRLLLINSGKFTKEQIDQIDDKSLMDFYNNFLTENPQLLKDSLSTNENSVNVEAVTADDVRQTLLDQGMTADELSQIDDAALMQMYREALDQAKNGNQ